MTTLVDESSPAAMDDFHAPSVHAGSSRPGFAALPRFTPHDPLTQQSNYSGSAGPRRVLFLDHTATMGGGEIALLNLVQNLDPARYTASVALFSDGPLAQALRAADIKTLVLPLSASIADARKDGLGGKSLLRLKDVLTALGFIRRLAAFLRSQKPDLVHTNSLKSDLLGGLAARLAGVLVLWHVRDRISPDYLPLSVVRLFRFLARRLPNYLVANSRATLETLLPTPAAAVPGYMVVVHDGTPLLDAAAEEESSGVVASWGSGVGAGSVTESSRGGVAEYAPNPTTPPPDYTSHSPVVGLVGRITPWKGQDVFLRAAARVARRFPAARFQVIGAALFGETAFDRSLRHQAAALGIADRVEFTGFRTDVPALISRLDLLVHASVIPEPFGQVVIEAMAAGKPVVATAGGGIPEIVQDGITGLLVPMADDAGLAAAIESLLSDPAAARRMGQLGRQRVRDHFTMATVAANMQATYDRMLLQRLTG